MVELSLHQRDRIAEKVMELGNLIFIGLVIVQIVPGPFIKILSALLGCIIFVLTYGIAYQLMKGGEH